MKIGIFYGSTTGFTETVAELIRDRMLDEVSIFKDISEATPEELLACDGLVLGISTWDDGQLQSDWYDFFPKLNGTDFSGKPVAIFGLGDQYTYGETFLDAVGTLGKKIESRGGTLIGSWPVDGYEFVRSAAVRDGRFMGLAIDEENQDKLTAQRVDRWTAQIRAEFASVSRLSPAF